MTSNPLETLELPAVTGRRERVASPAEAGQLLAALPDDLRPLYGTAFFAGLRRGELRGLRWEDVDTAAGRIHVCRGWDDHEGEIEPKSAKGTREVPVPAVLRDLLVEWKLSSGRRDGLVFGRTATEPFTPSFVRTRAKKAWTAAELTPIGLHECRHTFVTLMFEAGVPLERIGDYVGHSSTYMTDRYRHLLDGHAAEAAAMLDAFLERADTAARVARVDVS